MDDLMTRLNKWKKDKDKKKKEAKAARKIPFLVSHSPSGCFPPPPPLPKAKPSTPGNVRLQSGPRDDIIYISSSSCESVSDLSFSSVEDVDSDVRSVMELTAVNHFYLKLITKKCEKWEKILQKISSPAQAQEEVFGTVKPALLMVSRMVKQVTMLVERCLYPEPGQSPVTLNDLQGFCDCTDIQIQHIIASFNKLQVLRAQNWVEKAHIEPRRLAKANLATASRLRNSSGADNASDVKRLQEWKDFKRHLTEATFHRCRSSISYASDSWIGGTWRPNWSLMIV